MVIFVFFVVYQGHEAHEGRESPWGIGAGLNRILAVIARHPPHAFSAVEGEASNHGD